MQITLVPLKPVPSRRSCALSALRAAAAGPEKPEPGPEPGPERSGVDQLARILVWRLALPFVRRFSLAYIGYSLCRFFSKSIKRSSQLHHYPVRCGLVATGPRAVNASHHPGQRHSRRQSCFGSALRIPPSAGASRASRSKEEPGTPTMAPERHWSY